MAYAAIADVQRLFHAHAGFVIEDTSTPSETDVEAWIAEHESQLNGLLKAAGYSVPVTGSNDVPYLRKLVAEKTACKTWGIAFPVDTDQLPAQVKGWCEAWDAALKAIKDGEFTLVDQDIRLGMGVIYPTMMFDDED